MTRRRTLLPFFVAILLGAIGWTLSSSAAYAGGPTSVLMTNPQLGRASALHIDNPLYDRLYAAVGEGETGPLGPPNGLNSDQDEVRLTWLIHDMQIWRIDRVHVTSGDGIWLATVIDPTSDGDVFDQPARWHRAKDEKALTALLTGAGLLGADPAPSSPTSPATTEPTTAATSTQPRPAAAVVGAALGGLAVGAAGSLLLRRRTISDRSRVTLSG